MALPHTEPPLRLASVGLTVDNWNALKHSVDITGMRVIRSHARTTAGSWCLFGVCDNDRHSGGVPQHSTCQSSRQSWAHARYVPPHGCLCILAGEDAVPGVLRDNELLVASVHLLDDRWHARVSPTSSVTIYSACTCGSTPTSASLSVRRGRALRQVKAADHSLHEPLCTQCWAMAGRTAGLQVTQARRVPPARASCLPLRMTAHRQPPQHCFPLSQQPHQARALMS